ncbi:MAG: flagellar filament capping protein FliD [Burkholderiales bacterium]|nr:flagellar filament capping protein FliD [Burkholderiales bacterium]
MAGLTAAGVGSGLDVNSLVSSLMSVERRGLSKIQTDQQGINSRISAYGNLTSGLSALTDAAKKLTQTNIVSSLSASSGNKDAVGVTADSTATPGSNMVKVTQLAQAQRIIGPRVTDTTATIGTGKITIALGSYDSTDNSFTTKTDTTPVEITIAEGQSTLEGIRDAINAASAGVNASIVNDGQGFRLVMTSANSGSSNSMKVTISDNDGSNTNDETGGATPTASKFDAANLGGLSFMSFDPTAAGEGSGKNMVQIQAAQSAELTVDGISISSESNSVSSAIKGVTFSLNQITTADVRIDVKRDTTALTNAMTGFVSTFNAVSNAFKAQIGKDGILSRETTPSGVMRQLRNSLSGNLASNGLSLNDAGLSFDKDGVLSFSSTKFNTAIAADPDIARKIFADTGTTSDSRVSYLGATTKTVPGTYNIVVNASSDGVSTNADVTLNGAAAKASTNVITGAEGDRTDGLAIRLVNGNTGSLGTVTFSRGFASGLMKTIETLVSTNGSVANRTSTLNKQMRALELKTERENTRLADIERRYRAQYSALDSQLSKMQSTSSYIAANLG